MRGRSLALILAAVPGLAPAGEFRTFQGHSQMRETVDRSTAI